MSLKYQSSKSGFAVIIALSLMSFIVLLLLSMTTLVRVETQTAEISKSQLAARQNALLGLQIAIGQLQRYTGPDQVATTTTQYLFGTSPLVNPDPPDPLPDDWETPSQTVNQKHWTGVWTESPIEGQPRHLMWLVSGNENVNPDNPAFQEGTSLQTKLDARPTAGNGSLASDSIWMVNRVVGNDNDKVQVPLVDVDESGQYAFWVSDESVKANVAVTNKLAASGFSTTERDEYAISTSQSIEPLALTSNSSSFSGGVFTSSPNDQDLAKVFGLNDLAASPDVSTNYRRDFFHDITTVSRSLLADSRNGGLKKDLTAAFNSNSEFTKLITNYGFGHPVITGGGSRSIFEAADLDGDGDGSDDRSLANPGGPTWDQLRSYFNLNGSSGSVPLTTQTETSMGVYPIITDIQLAFYASIHDLAAHSSGATWGGRAWIMPAFAFFNPYNVDILVPETFIRITNDRSFVTSFHPSPLIKDMALAVVFQGGGSGTMILEPNSFPLVFKIAGFTIPAGETRIVSPTANASLQGPTSTADNGLSVGFRRHGFFSDSDWGTTSAIHNIGTPTVEPTEARIGWAASEQKSLGNAKNSFFYLEWATSKAAFVDPTSSGSYANDNRIIQKINHLFTNNWGGGATGSHRLSDPVAINKVSQAVSGTADLDTLLAPNPDQFPGVGLKYRLIPSHPSGDTAWPIPDVYDRQRVGRWLAQSNPRAPFYQLTPIDFAVGSREGVANFSYEGTSTAFTKGAYEFSGAPSSGEYYNGIFFDKTAIGMDRTVLFELPTNELLSIGELTHANLTRSHNFHPNSDRLSSNNPGESGSLSFLTTALYLANNLNQSYPIGNSVLDARIPYTRTFYDWAGNNHQNFSFPTISFAGSSGVHYDYSYHLNDALWDRFFFSTVPATGSISDSTILANGRLQIEPESTAAELRDFDQAATQLTLNGAFNVNSNSVDAWKAFIGSFYELPVGSNTNPNTIPLTRMRNPTGGPVQDSTTEDSLDEDPLSYEGYRRLTESEVDQLARNIVEVYQERRSSKGPYLNLADFVNRDPNAGSRKHAMRGLLSQAIDPDAGDTSTKNLNNEYRRAEYYRRDESSDAASNHGDWIYKDAGPLRDAAKNSGGEIASTDPAYSEGLLPNESGPLAENIPGFLSQADLMMRLGAAMTTRSDTFTIRGYGSSVDTLNSQPESEVWCEAVVQRLPEYIDSADSAEVLPENLTSTDNINFGRRYKVVSIRWLPNSEI